MHDDRPGRPEPRLERGDPGQLVALLGGHVRAGLEQVLLHVVAEVVEQLDLFLQGRRELRKRVVVLVALEVDVVNIPEKKMASIKFSENETRKQTTLKC